MRCWLHGGGGGRGGGGCGGGSRGRGCGGDRGRGHWTVTRSGRPLSTCGSRMGFDGTLKSHELFTHTMCLYFLVQNCKLEGIDGILPAAIFGRGPKCAK